MKDSGIMRRVDSLGRFVLPKELRRQLQIECNDYDFTSPWGSAQEAKKHKAIPAQNVAKSFFMLLCFLRYLKVD